MTRQRTIAFPKLGPGLYVAKILIDGKPNPSTTHFTVSGVKTITRAASDKHIELLAVDARTGKPLPKAEVTLYASPYFLGQESVEKARLRTDKNGLCRIETGDEGFLFTQVSTPLDRFAPADRLSLPGCYDDSDDSDTRTALFTDRSLYRPGQTLYFSGIRYINSTDEHRTIGGEHCTVSLLDPSSREVRSTQVVTDAYGQFTGSFVIPRGNLLGNYTLRVNQSWGDRLSISVAEYKLPMFRVEFKPVTEGTSFGQPVTLQGSARSYSGVPQAGASVRYTIYRQANPFFRYFLPSAAKRLKAAPPRSTPRAIFPSLSRRNASAPNRSSTRSKPIYTVSKRPSPPPPAKR